MIFKNRSLQAIKTIIDYNLDIIFILDALINLITIKYLIFFEILILTINLNQAIILLFCCYSTIACGITTTKFKIPIARPCPELACPAATAIKLATR